MTSSESDKAEFLPGFPTLDRFNAESLRSVAAATKASNGLPSDRKEDWDFYTTFKGFRQVTEAQSESIRQTIADLLKYNGIKGRPTDNVADVMELLADANDQLLERISTYLDEAAGLRKEADPLLLEINQASTSPKVSGSWNKGAKAPPETPPAAVPANEAKSVKLLAAKHVVRPQMSFKDKIDNSINPFVPRLTEKPHSMKPLSILVECTDDGEEFYSHPYLYEMEHVRMTKRQMLHRPAGENKANRDMNSTPFAFVDTPRALKAMIAELKNEPEIAVDLEHHHYRSFLGLTCLIQVSSATKDYVIDPFPLWTELTMLNEIFANPHIVKVLHGAVNDILWLQRDFSVYVVNMFDTFVAARLLDFPRGCMSLAFLLHNYAHVVTDKKFQLADWRMRPLAPEMIHYARMDTHYLIDIYHSLKDTLLDRGNELKNLLVAAYSQSNELCKQRYEKPQMGPNSHLHVLTRSKANFNSRQLFAFRELFAWRNKVARMEDEGELYVLPPHMLLKICSELPREMQGILACCNPVPPLVKQSLHFLHDVIVKAREQPLSVVGSLTTAEQDSLLTQKKYYYDVSDVIENPLRCPLDLSFLDSAEDCSAKLDVLLDNQQTALYKDQPIVIPNKESATMGALGRAKKVPSVGGNKVGPSEEVRVFLSPYQRYLLLKPYMSAMNKSNDPEVVHQSDADRVKSIKEHFDALTAMTPQDLTGETKVNEEAVKDEEESDEDVSLDNFDPDPGEYHTLRPGFNLDRIKHKETQQGKFKEEIKSHKRQNDNDKSISPKMPKLEETDFSQYAGGAKANTAFDPMKEFKDKHVKKKPFGGGRQKQRYKAGGRSVSYKK